MQPPSLQPLIYKKIFPRSQSSDPQDFLEFVRQCIVPEVRQESARFYGPEECIEANYPGLDYASKAHRTRLRLYPWHRRLFRAFDDLKLSPGDIHQLCRWEGTKWSKERYERENKTTIRDTTWDGVKAYGRPLLQVQSRSESRKVPPLHPRLGSHVESTIGISRGSYLEDSATEDDIVSNSYGAELHQRLITATEARARGEQATLDPAWEQWMKDVTDRGLLQETGHVSSTAPTRSYHSYMPPLTYSPRMQQTSIGRYATTDIYRYSPTTSSPSSAVPTNDSRRRMAPPPLLPRLRPARPSTRSSAPAT